jgi:tripartite-type tricarboxylate transporter receptor subunit TctC
VPVSISGATPNALVVPAGNGDRPRSLAELLARGSDAARPPLRHVSPGNGTSHHLACVQLRRAAGAGFRSEHIPYRGPPESLAGLLAGEADWGFPALPSTLSLAREGRVRVLGVTGRAPAPTLPEAPTLASLGMPEFEEMDVWYGVAAPRAGTPPEALAALRVAFREALAEPALQARLASAGFDPVAPPMDGPAMETFLARQVALWEELVQASATLD